MKLDKIQELLSSPRFDRYLAATKADQKQAMKLYRANLVLCRSLHPVFGTFEVVLRNKLDQEMAVHFRSADWSISSRRFLPGFMISELQKAENRLMKSKGSITHSKLLADQMLGFWTAHFEKENFRKLGGCPIQAFKNLPKSVRRDELSSRMNSIRIFRNRINHNEPVCFSGNVVDFSKTELIYLNLCELMNWIDPEARKLLSGIDKTQALINRIIRQY